MTTVAYPELKLRRDELRAAGLCINGPKAGGVSKNGIAHGPVVSGGKCQRCVDVHRGGRSSGPASETRIPDCESQQSDRDALATTDSRSE